MNNLEEVCVAYAEVFQVIIHIRRLEIQGNRHQFFYHPSRKTALTAEKHITLMLVDECNVDHCHSMLDIRKWCQPYQTANRINVTGYCDYCCKVKTQNNRSKAQDLLHMNECRGAFYEPGLRPNTYEDHNFQPFTFKKESKNEKACYQCKLCHSKITHKYLLSNGNQCLTNVLLFMCRLRFLLRFRFSFFLFFLSFSFFLWLFMEGTVVDRSVLS